VAHGLENLGGKLKLSEPQARTPAKMLKRKFPFQLKAVRAAILIAGAAILA
jgi:hypothetical protein